MKKIYNLILIAILMCFTMTASKAMDFAEGFAKTSRTPLVVLIYAEWADGYKNCQEQYKSVQKAFLKNYNFVELDIAKPEAKAFNDKFHIYPKLPYILMLRDNGKVARYIPRDCASDAKCIKDKLKAFIQ